jgi:hypothetical protein
MPARHKIFRPGFVGFYPITRDDSYPVFIVRGRLYGHAPGGGEVSSVVDHGLAQIRVSCHSADIEKAITLAVGAARASYPRRPSGPPIRVLGTVD